MPHSNPTVGSMPFSFSGQGNNPFQSWTNPAVSGLGARNQSYFSQQGNMPYSSVNYFQNFSPYANPWNPYQGLSTPFNTSLGGNITNYRGFVAGVDQTPNFDGSQGSPCGSVGSTNYFRQPGAFTNPGHSFQNIGSSAHTR